MTLVKICGLKDEINLEAALINGADFVGFVFFEASPRNITIPQAALLAQQSNNHAKRVGLFVDPSDADLEAVLKEVDLDFIQLHGTETNIRVAEISERFNKPVIKAFRVADKADLDEARSYDAPAWLLFDAHVPGDLPGGTGQSFDWSLLESCTFEKPWMLSGGLHAGNVGGALKALKPDAIDVSSGVEKKRGEKDAAKIKSFIEAVKS